MKKLFKTIALIGGAAYVAKKAWDNREVIKSEFKMAMETVKAQQEVFHMTENKELDGVNYVHGHTLLRSAGMAIAGAVLMSDGRKQIVVDDLFFKHFDKDSQKFILHHEQGHIKLGHLDKYKKEGRTTHSNLVDRKITEIMGGVQQEELEADDYAASVIGKEKAFYALSMVGALYIKAKGKPSKEIIARMKRIDPMKGGEKHA